MGDRIQSCRNPVFTEKGSVISPLCITLIWKCDLEKWRSIFQGVTAVIDTIESLFEIYTSDLK